MACARAVLAENDWGIFGAAMLRVGHYVLEKEGGIGALFTQLGQITNAILYCKPLIWSLQALFCAGFPAWQALTFGSGLPRLRYSALKSLLPASGRSALKVTCGRGLAGATMG